MITTEEKVKLIRDLAKKHDITSYEIGENTTISSKTAYNIFNDNNIKPRNKTLNIILDYIEKTIVGTHSKISVKEEYTTENRMKKGAVAEDMYLNEEHSSYDKPLNKEKFKDLSIEEKLTALFELENLNSKKLDVISNAVGKLLLDIEESTELHKKNTN